MMRGRTKSKRERAVCRARNLLVLSLGLLGITHGVRADYLFDGDGLLGFIDHHWSSGVEYQSSVWDNFYARYEAGGNMPDVYAPYGGVETAPGSGLYVGETRAAANSHGLTYGPGGLGTDFAQDSTHTPNNSAGPVAFWDARNPTITQTAGSASSVLLTSSGNIYSWAHATSFRLDDSINNFYMELDQLETVVFQFQTEGNQVDFSSIYLEYVDYNGQTQRIYANDFAGGADYLREYRAAFSGHWSAATGYSNRVAVQWDLSSIVDQNGNPYITSYSVYWDAASSSMSLQSAALSVADTYEAAIPATATWSGSGAGNWSDSSRWQVNDSSLPYQNGNLRFTNAGATTVTLNQGDQNIGEMIFESAHDVTIRSAASQKLISNTGIKTTSSATGVYTIESDYELGTVNFFEINGGAVIMAGDITGNDAIVKTGEGMLVLQGDNHLGTGGLGLYEGSMRLEGVNTYSGQTAILDGTLYIAAQQALSGTDISLGADSFLYSYVSGGQILDAGLIVDGDFEVTQNINPAAGNYIKRIGAVNTQSSGALFSGDISLTIVPVDTDIDPDPLAATSTASEVYFTTGDEDDKVTFTGAITGGNNNNTLKIEGPGRVVYAGEDKDYNHHTEVTSGTLEIAEGTKYTGSGNTTVKAPSNLVVNGVLQGAGSLTLDGGTLSGTGTVKKNLLVHNGSVLSPGNSVGKLTFGEASALQTLTLGSGGSYAWELDHATGTAGQNWDLVEVHGTLDVTATEEGKFVISLQSSATSMFNPMNDYDWIILSATGGIMNFNQDSFSFDSSAFGMDILGHFSLAVVGNDLVLSYVHVVPEPGRAFLLVSGIFTFLLRRRRSF